MTPVYFSDHYLVTGNVGNKPRYKSTFNWKRWKLNVRLLKNEGFLKNVDEMSETILNFLKQLLRKMAQF